jgi:hypothetical protein
MVSQQFDTGLPLPQRTALRRAIVAHLGTAPTGHGTPLLKSRGGYVAAIGQAARTIGDAEDLAILMAAFQNTAPSPAIAVALGDQRFTAMGIGAGDNWTGELELAVYAVSTHPRSLVEGRLAPDVTAAGDATVDPGIETMLEHIRELLCGQELGIATLHEIRPKAEREVATGADVTIWEHSFTVQVDVPINAQRAVSDLMTSIEAQVDIESGGLPITTITEFEAP